MILAKHGIKSYCNRWVFPYEPFDTKTALSYTTFTTFNKRGLGNI